MLRTTIERSGCGHPDVQAFSQDGSKFAAFDPPYLKVWCTNEGKELGRLNVFEDVFPGSQEAMFAFTAAQGEDERLLLIGSDTTVLTWRVGTSKPVSLCTLEAETAVPLHTEPPLISAGGKRVVSITRSVSPGTLLSPSTLPTVGYVWELPTGKQVSQFAFQTGLTITTQQRRASISPDAKKIAILNGYDIIKVWDFDTDEERCNLGRAFDYVEKKKLRLSRDGAYLAAVKSQWRQAGGKMDRYIKVFDVSAGSELFSTSIAIPEQGGSPCIALAEQARLVAVGQGEQISVYAPRSGGKLAILEGHNGTITDLAFDQSATLLASASAADATVRLWNPASKDVLAMFHTPQKKKKLTSVALSPTGRWLAVGDSEGQVRLWDLWEVRRRLRAAGLDWSTQPIPHTRDAAMGQETLTLDGHQPIQAAPSPGESLHRYARTYYVTGLRQSEPGGNLNAACKYFKIAIDTVQELVADYPTVEKYQESLARSYHSLAMAQEGLAEPNEAVESYQKAIEIKEGLLGENPTSVTHQKTLALSCNSLAWLLSTYPAGAIQNAERAVELAEKAVELTPQNGFYWNTLGVARYRAGDWKAAIEALAKSMELRSGGDSFDWFFLSVSHSQLEEKEEARNWYDKAVKWMEENIPDNKELIRFRAEAAELLGVRNETKDEKETEDGPNVPDEKDAEDAKARHPKSGPTTAGPARKS